MNRNRPGCEECGYSGFLLVQVDNDPNDCRIEKCDACDTFETDSEANAECFRLACRQLDRQEKEG